MTEAHNRRKRLVDGKLECPKCEKWKSIDEFHKSKNALYGRASRCKICAGEAARVSHAKNKGCPKRARQVKSRYLERTYEMTIDDFESMVLDNGGTCEICNCKLDMSGLTHVDHCHKTGVVRGVLCSTCNRGLGYFKDNVEVLEGAVKYLRRHYGK